MKFTTSYLEDSLELLRYYKKLAERAMDQVTDEQLYLTLDEEANSIGIVVKHIVGNMRSRWTDFLTTDGEKPDRDRDAEFVVAPGTTREALLARWEEGWRCALAALAALTPEDLAKTVYVRGEPHSVPRAIHRQLTHHAYHVGQIVMLAKHLAGPRWRTLSVPRATSR